MNSRRFGHSKRVSPPDAIDVDELRELLVDAWRMCVPKKVAAAYDG